jgi:hypothetical protein
MTEGRKRVLLIAASILAARRLAQLEYKSCPAFEACIADAIAAAEKILKKIDSRWPAPEHVRDF